jgi:hypothetical protein
MKFKKTDKTPDSEARMTEHPGGGLGLVMCGRLSVS